MLIIVIFVNDPKSERNIFSLDLCFILYVISMKSQHEIRFFLIEKKSYELYRTVIQLFDRELRNIDDRMFKSQVLYKDENNSDNT